MSEQQKKNKEQAETTKSGRGANKCLICGRKQGLVTRHNIMLCRQCFRENAAKIGFKKMN